MNCTEVSYSLLKAFDFLHTMVGYVINAVMSAYVAPPVNRQSETHSRQLEIHLGRTFCIDWDVKAQQAAETRHER